MFSAFIIYNVLESRQVGIISTYEPVLWWLSVNVQCQNQCQLDTFSLNFHVCWVAMFDNVIQKPVLQKHTKVNLSQLNLTPPEVESLKLTNPNLKNFKLFFSNTILYYFQPSKKLNPPISKLSFIVIFMQKDNAQLFALHSKWMQNT